MLDSVDGIALLTAKEAAMALKVDPRTLERWHIPCVRTPGGHKRYLPSTLRTWLQERQLQEAACPPATATAKGRRLLQARNISRVAKALPSGKSSSRSEVIEFAKAVGLKARKPQHG